MKKKINGTQKNLSTIPVSTAALIGAKVITLLIFSLIYSLATSGATILGGFVIGAVDHVVYRLLVSVVISIKVLASILPIIAIECLCNKGYIFSVIISFVYASASFAIVFAMSNILSPLSAVFRWALPHITNGPTYGLDNWFLSTPSCIGVLILTATASLTLAVIFKKKQEI